MKEYLFSCGFHFHTDTYFLNGFAVFVDDGNFFYELRSVGMMDLHIKDIPQLNRLYLALTEKELQPNE